VKIYLKIVFGKKNFAEVSRTMYQSFLKFVFFSLATIKLGFPTQALAEGYKLLVVPQPSNLSERLKAEEFEPRNENFYLKNGISRLSSCTTIATYPNIKIDLGMNGLLPKDQGADGTCATFATVAAIQAQHNIFLNENLNYEIEQCSLAVQGGWNGKSPAEVVQGFWEWGVIPPANCPWSYPNKNVSLSSQEYIQLAQGNLLNQIHWRGTSNPKLSALIASIDKGFRSVISVYISPSQNFTDAKIALNNLPTGVTQLNTGGLRFDWGKKEFKELQMKAEKQKTSPEKIFCPNSNCNAHAMVVHGYDRNRNVLLLRNSWSSVDGLAEMSFDYFRKMAYKGIILGEGGGQEAGWLDPYTQTKCDPDIHN
jgi:hypothetical protein